MKRLKRELRDTDLVMYIDMAERFKETHFGGNRPPQITIHISVSYNALEVK